MFQMGPSISSIQDIFISSPYHQRPENQCNNMCDAHYITKNEPTNNLNDVAPFFLFLARNSFRQVPMRDQKGIKTNNGKVSLISNTAWFPSQPTIKHSSKHGRFAYNLPNGFSFRECFFFFFFIYGTDLRTRAMLHIFMSKGLSTALHMYDGEW